MMCTHASGQYLVSGEIREVAYQFQDVSVSLRTNQAEKQLKLTNNGKFMVSLDWNKTYHFLFKKPGYVSKVIEFSTHLPTGVSSEGIAPYDMPVRLFKVFEGVDTVFFKNPVAKIRFDKNKVRSNGEYGDFAPDVDYSLKVKYRIEQMKQDGQALKKPNDKENSGLPFVKETNDSKKSYEQVSIVESKQGKALTKTIKEIKGIQPLKIYYPPGETVEEFNLDSRVITRHIFVVNSQRRVFLSVKHNWGGHYFFIDEAHIGYRCISREIYDYSLEKCRTNIKDNK